MAALLPLGPGTASAAPAGPPHTASAAPAGPPHTAPSASAPADPSADRTVTLVTGDRVRVAPGPGGRLRPESIVPGPGRERISFTSSAAGGHLTVTPSDAQPLLRSGRVDPRLFDVSTLLEFGYDDRGRADLPLIVTGDTTRTRARAGALRRAGGVRSWRGGAAFRAVKRDATGSWKALAGDVATSGSGVTKLWLDGLRRPQLKDSVPQIGAPSAWAAGFDGRGVTVGVVDSGIDSTHPDLAGQVVAQQNFVDDGQSVDLTGHGTHVAATIAGTGAAAGSSPGVAPGARLVAARVCIARGCPESAMLAGMQWVADAGAKVINMSVGGPDTPGQDVLEQAVERITADKGALFVIAAGNEGLNGDGTVSSPGSAESALTVGAVSKTDEIAEFSSRGPRQGDGAIKPDVTAPGVGILAARASTSPGDPNTLLVSKNGTSMATPHVAGAAAILAQEHPAWTPAQLKSALMGSAVANPDLRTIDQGAGRIDLTRGIRQAVLATPPSVSVQDTWPPETAPITRTISYQNTGTEPVTLALALSGSAPDGMFRLSTDSVTVPAGGTAGVQLAVDSSRATEARQESYLVASGGGEQVTTPLSAAVETEETFELHLSHLGRDGGAPGGFVTSVIDPQRGTETQLNTADARLRLPKGRYVLMTRFDPPSPTAPQALVLEPGVELDHDLAVTMDERVAKPVRIGVPLPDAASLPSQLGTSIYAPNGALLDQVTMLGPLSTMLVGSSHPERSDPGVESIVNAQFGRSGTAAEDSPYLVHAAWRQQGNIFSGIDRTVRASDLAMIKAEFAGTGIATGRVTYETVSPVTGGLGIDVAGVRLPSTRPDFYNTDTDLRRRVRVEEGGIGAELGSTTDAGRVLQPLQVLQERYNAAVFGPGFTFPRVVGTEGVDRREDVLRLRPTLVNDRDNRLGRAVSADHFPVITLDRDGTQVYQGQRQSASVRVPAGPATYRLSAKLTRPALTLSTAVDAEWTFRSDTLAGDAWVPQPLSVVRFQPKLDLASTARAGSWFDLPVQVQRQPGSSAGPVRTLAVEASYDDGTTWAAVPVTRQGDGGIARLRHPAGPGYVSLRAAASDAAGNTVRQTIVRAYRIG